jgi:hydrophobe/amphiphile efflux-3 (HAE3) family protein
VRYSLSRLIDGAAFMPRRIVAGAVVLAVAGAVLALGLQPSTGVDTFVSRGSADARATDVDARQFGGDAVVVLVREPLTELLETSDLEVVSRLETCLAGSGNGGGPCGSLHRVRPAHVVYGPGTFLSRAVAAVSSQITLLGDTARTAITDAERTAEALALARGLSRAQAKAASTAAGALEAERQVQQLAGFASGSELGTEPAIDNPAFIERIVFAAGGAPKPRLHYLFPSRDAALIQVRLRAGLSTATEQRAIGWIRAAVALPAFRLAHGGSYLVSGEPVVLSDLASTITSSIVVLLVGSVVVMAVVLLLAVRGTLRLLPLAVALAAAAITFGLTALAGATLTIASIAVLPVLIGLAVDYAIQFQSRVRQGGAVESVGGRAPATLAAAATATAAGFAVLFLSPVPMVRGFGLLLVVGVVVALALTLTVGAAAPVLAAGGGSRTATPDVARLPGLAGASLRGAGELLREAGELVVAAPRALGRRLERAFRRVMPETQGRRPVLARLLGSLSRHPGRVFAVALVIAAGGWFADTRTTVQSDITKLVPPSMPALRDLRTLERVTGSSGELDVIVRARDVATPRTVTWMIAYENAVLAHFGFESGHGCAAAQLCPALSLPDLFAGGTGTVSTGASGSDLSGAAIDSLLATVPAYFSQAVITKDRRYGALAFGIRLMPLARQERVIAYLRARLHPPPGVSAAVAGLPVLAADANRALASTGRRMLMLLAALAAVALVLLATFRRPARALVPLAPIVLATGWSSLVADAIGIPLNPMSATLGALVIAISTEFSVLLSERVREERASGLTAAEALERAYRSTGSAILASGVTAVAGFAVLMLSDITMLRDFGAVTVIDLTVSLAGVLAVLPAAIAVADRRGAPALAASPPRPRPRAPVG